VPSDLAGTLAANLVSTCRHQMNMSPAAMDGSRRHEEAAQAIPAKTFVRQLVDSPSWPSLVRAPNQDTQHLFATLPPELRLRIWSLSLPPPRIVTIRCGSNSILEQDAHPPPPPSGCVSTARIPVNLHTCHESRAEALRTYQLSFGMYRGPGQIFFDFRQDVFYFSARDGFMASDSQFTTAMMLCNQDDLARVQRVAINDALFWISDMYDSMSAATATVRAIDQLRMRMPALRELIFVPREQNPIYSNETVFVEPAIEQMRMQRQIQAAMEAVKEEHPEWSPPTWRIMTLSAVPDPTMHNRIVLGYHSAEEMSGRRGGGSAVPLGAPRALTNWPASGKRTVQ
jgi:2EXR family